MLSFGPCYRHAGKAAFELTRIDARPGYNFGSLRQISPFLEHKGSGITSLWARTVALKYGCAVAVGYPETVDVSANWPTGPEYYNALLVINSDGETIANYRKTHLYYTDETWACMLPRWFFLRSLH